MTYPLAQAGGLWRIGGNNRPAKAHAERTWMDRGMTHPPVAGLKGARMGGRESVPPAT